MEYVITHKHNCVSILSNQSVSKHIILSPGPSPPSDEKVHGCNQGNEKNCVLSQPSLRTYYNRKFSYSNSL